MKVITQHFYGTTDEWQQAGDPVLYKGVWGFEKKKDGEVIEVIAKIGDGEKRWNELEGFDIKGLDKEIKMLYASIAAAEAEAQELKKIKYEKPSGGIPKKDLDSSVKNSLDKADSALQKSTYHDNYWKPYRLIKLDEDGTLMTSEKSESDFSPMMVSISEQNFTEFNLETPAYKTTVTGMLGIIWHKIRSVINKVGTIDAHEAVEAEAAQRQAADNQSNQAIENINKKIPNQASETNQLADKNFTNSSISNMAANYVTPNAEGDAQFASLNALRSGPWYHGGASYTPSQNDYAIYLNTDNSVWRAAFNGQLWSPTYKINDTPFTAAQLAALNSQITAALVQKLLNPDSEPAQNSDNLVKSGGVFAWFGGLLSALKTTAKTVIGAVNELFDSKANTASPTFTGTPRAPTPAASVNDTQIATMAAVRTAAENVNASIASSLLGQIPSRPISLYNEVNRNLNFLVNDGFYNVLAASHEHGMPDEAEGYYHWLIIGGNSGSGGASQILITQTGQMFVRGQSHIQGSPFIKEDWRRLDTPAGQTPVNPIFTGEEFNFNDLTAPGYYSGRIAANTGFRPPAILDDYGMIVRRVGSTAADVWAVQDLITSNGRRFTRFFAGDGFHSWVEK